MTQPIDVSVPHRLGKAEARRRVAANIGKLQSYLPGGGTVTSAWAGDRLDLKLSALGQLLAASITVADDHVRCRLELPGLLGFAAAPLEAMLRRAGPELLEDHRR